MFYIFGGGQNHFTLLLYLTPKHVLETFGVQLLSIWLLAWLTSLCVGFLRNNQHEFRDVTTARNGEVLQEHSGADAYRCRFSPACLCWISSRKQCKEVAAERICSSGNLYCCLPVSLANLTFFPLRVRISHKEPQQKFRSAISTHRRCQSHLMME